MASTGAVVFLPLRVVSGRWSTSGVTASEDLTNTLKWLPHSRQPIGWVTIGGQRYPVSPDPMYYGFLHTVAEQKLGGINGSTLPDVVTAVETTISQAADVSSTTAAVAQQVQANADALAATIAVAQNNSLVGANDIPPAQTYTEIP